MCNREDQGLEERQMILSCSNAVNSAWAVDNFALSKHLNLDKIGGPEVVTM
jgi:hypothetical protein